MTGRPEETAGGRIAAAMDRRGLNVPSFRYPPGMVIVYLSTYEAELLAAQLETTP